VSVARRGADPRRTLTGVLLGYGAATLLHFAHNAQYLADYPNLPSSWTRGDVYGAWCGLTAFGVAGYVLYRRGRERLGLGWLAAYALSGFGGLLHYTRAPLAHHSAMMNLTILGEAVAALLLLANIVALWRSTGGFCIRDLDPQGEAALALLRVAAAEVRPLYPGREGAAAPSNPPLGAREAYVGAFRQGCAVACGALRRLDDTSAELCRLYVREELRRRGLARAIIGHLLARAARLGYRRVRLETGDRQAAAMALYEQLGFRRIAPFGSYVRDPTSVCYELELAESGAPRGCA
jgi:ribosomal protein S18 acetylase RimI-like enzyme